MVGPCEDRSCFRFHVVQMSHYLGISNGRVLQIPLVISAPWEGGCSSSEGLTTQLKLMFPLCTCRIGENP